MKEMFDPFYRAKPERQKLSEEAAAEKAKNIARRLEQSLLMYLRQPKGDSDTLENISQVITRLGHALAYVGDTQAGESRQKDFDAVMRGVIMMLDPARERKFDNDSTAPWHANRFVELVNQRFGYLKDSKT